MKELTKPLRFVVLLGAVSLFADVTYEGARSVTGPYLALLGASAAAVGAVVFGALFLARFVPDRVRWAHLDIAGIAWRDTPSPYHQKGGTGSPVRTLIAWLEGLSRG